MIIGVYNIQKRIIGTKTRTIAIERKISTKDAVLKYCLIMDIICIWKPNIRVVPIDMSVIIPQRNLSNNLLIKKMQAEPAIPPMRYKRMLSPYPQI